MSTITTKDGTGIYYKDWGRGPVVTFSHGWPLNSDAWDGQLHFLVQNGFRVVALDRRGHGRSSQPSSGNNMDGYADDLAAVIEALDLDHATLVGHSTGGGRVARSIGRHRLHRGAQAVLVAAVPPLMLKTSANPEGKETTALALVSALSQEYGFVIPWRLVSKAIDGALNARFLELGKGSVAWPSQLAASGAVKLRLL